MAGSGSNLHRADRCSSNGYHSSRRYLRADVKVRDRQDRSSYLIQVNGPVGLANWKDYCLDLSNSEIYSHLTSDDYALKNDAGEVPGIAYVIETYGIIYNKTILNDYCTMDNAVISSPEDINNFETLKAVADDIQARLDEINDQFGYDLKGSIYFRRYGWIFRLEI